ncbi:MAG: AAA-like domain-containing protein [Verrucomicrobia bacterium]|nr:AAA-like domain-containing protein [Verrucomicrobiota bacterium]
MCKLNNLDPPVLEKTSSAVSEKDESIPKTASEGTSAVPKARVFISYKRETDPDEKIALAVCEALNKLHEVFIDQTMLVGEDWTKRIEAELRRADYLITFLSAQSVRSEMVIGEVEKAYRLSKEPGRSGRPRILPVRLAYREPFDYPLNAYLSHIQWTLLMGPEELPRLIQELTQAVCCGRLAPAGAQSESDVVQTCRPLSLQPPLPSAQPITFERPEGTMMTQSPFYVEREADSIALETIKDQGVTITIKGPRQIGKSSLLNRILEAAVKAGKRFVFLDYQLIDRSVLADRNLFFRQFCSWLTDELEMDDQTEKYWSLPFGNSQRCTRYLSRYVLKELGGPLLLAMDEVDRLFDADFRSDFFGMLRAWHNSRANPATPVWKGLDLALIISTEPYELIEDLNQSPFNVGQVISLADFRESDVSDLNRRHGSPLSPDEEKRLTALVGGHPYLVRRALYLLANKSVSVAELFASANALRGPFGDHLRYHLFRLYDKEPLIQGLRQAIHKNVCPDERILFRLQGAGLVRAEGNKILPRCELYARFFEEHLHD